MGEQFQSMSLILKPQSQDSLTLHTDSLFPWQQRKKAVSRTCWVKEALRHERHWLYLSGSVPSHSKSPSHALWDLVLESEGLEFELWHCVYPVDEIWASMVCFLSLCLMRFFWVIIAVDLSKIIVKVQCGAFKAVIPEPGTQSSLQHLLWGPTAIQTDIIHTIYPFTY